MQKASSKLLPSGQFHFKAMPRSISCFLSWMLISTSVLCFPLVCSIFSACNLTCWEWQDSGKDSLHICDILWWEAVVHMHQDKARPWTSGSNGSPRRNALCVSQLVLTGSLVLFRQKQRLAGCSCMQGSLGKENSEPLVFYRRMPWP